MSTKTFGSIALILLLGRTSVWCAADEPQFSGPQPGERLLPFKVVLAYGDRAGDPVDFVKEAAGKPLLLVFVNGANRPAARLTRVLMNYAEMRKAEGFYAALVWLDDDRTAAQQYLKKAVSWWGIGLPVGVSVDGAEGPGSYGLNRNVNVTVLIARDNRVTANFALVQPSETDAPKILKKVVELIGGEVPSSAEVLFLSAPTRKLDDAKWATAPQDVTFRRLVCSLLAAKEPNAARTAARTIEEFARGKPTRVEQLNRIAEMLSRGRTRVGAIPAARYFRRWRAETPNKNRRKRPGNPAAKQSRVRTTAELPILFDFGTSDSSVLESAVQVTEESTYEASRGFGWTSDQQQAFDRDGPLPQLRHGGNPIRPDLLYRDHATPLNQDGVSSTEDMRFRVDVLPGTYRVHVWVGDLHQTLESLAVECNSEVIATGVSAKHIIGRGQPESTGLYQILRFDIDAQDGRIEFRFFGDETQFRTDKRRYDSWFASGTRVESYLRTGFDPDRRLKFDPKGPFVRNSVLAVRIAPVEDALIRWDGSTLVATDKVSEFGERFVATFNRQEFQKAEHLLESRGVSDDLRIRGLTALVGHLEIEGWEEARLLQKLKQELATLEIQGRTTPGQNRAPSILRFETRESLRIFERARHRFLHRGMAEEGHFQENRKVVSLMRLIRPGDLLYWKSLEYEGRALQMLDPHRWVYPSGDAQLVWRRLIEAFPDNRYARFFLLDKWRPDDLWHHGDHLSATLGAPEWVVAQREAWGLLLDVCEWWAANKQHPDGSIGGGWGDDVELVGLFGLMGSLSEGASPSSVELSRRLIDGLWRFGGIDQQAGFYRGLLDAEHSAEWTGDTLPLMVTIDWGNPLWIERAMQSARLMRDFWMDYNDRGDLHFKSNFLGSMSIGNERQANDSYINYRAVLPVVSVYRYNRHPEIAELLVEWADAWLSDAMRGDRGKPVGVFPAEVGFPSGELGGVNSENWFTAAHPPGSVNYDWERGSYFDYLVSLMLLANQITGDEKYLEPFKLQKRLVDRYRANPVPSPQPGSEMWVARVLSKGTSRGRKPFDTIWHRVQTTRLTTNHLEPPLLINRDGVQERMNNVRRLAKQRWPVLTTETSATDRVGFPGIPDPFFVMTGTRDFHPAVTYSGVGRDFAAYVSQTGPKRLKVIMYNLSAGKSDIAITPWKLDVGTYSLRSGIDTNRDDQPDRAIHERTIDFKQRGQRIRFPFPPAKTTVVELRQVEPGRGPEPLADLAVASSEIKYSIWTRDLQVTIHNVGIRSARKILVTVYESDDSNRRRIGRQTVAHLSWPQDFLPRKLTIGFPYVPSRSEVTISVVVDELERIDEICESNNLGTRVFNFDLGEIHAPRDRLGEIGGDVSGQIKKGIR